MSIRKTTPILGAAAIAALTALSVPASAASHATKNVVLAGHQKVHRGGYAYPTRYCLPRSQAGFWGKGACR